MSVVYFNENTFRIRVNAALEKVLRLLRLRTPLLGGSSLFIARFPDRFRRLGEAHSRE